MSLCLRKCYSSSFKKINFYLFILGSSVLRGHFSSCCEWRLIFAAVLGLLTVAASLLAEHRLWGTWALVVVGPSLQSTGSTVVAHGIAPDQRSNQHLLYQQADSSSPRHQGSPGNVILLLILLLSHNNFVLDFLLILFYGSI